MRPPSATKILRVDPSSPSVEHLMEAARVVRGGGLVVFPTETVYGLGADAFNREAVRRIFEVKGRPLDNPLIVHVSSIGELERVARADQAVVDVYGLVRRFWPGPLTLVLPKRGGVPPEVTAGRETVAVRMPAHPVALKLIELSGTPIAAPSANLSGRPSPTRGEHAIRDLDGKVDVIIDSGETAHGVESTIVDLTRDPPVLLRPGAIPVEEIEKHIHRRVTVPAFARGMGEAEDAFSPGTKYRHYAPATPLVLVEAEDYSDLERYAEAVSRYAAGLRGSGRRVLVLASEETAEMYRGFDVLVLGSRRDLKGVARNLFSALRAVDELGVDVAVSEGFEEEGLGLTIMNRLRKASGYNVVKVE